MALTLRTSSSCTVPPAFIPLARGLRLRGFERVPFLNLRGMADRCDRARLVVGLLVKATFVFLHYMRIGSPSHMQNEVYEAGPFSTDDTVRVLPSPPPLLSKRGIAHSWPSAFSTISSCLKCRILN